MATIFHITKSQIGGGGVYARRLSDALRAAGLSSSVLCAEDGTLVRDAGYGRLFDRALGAVLRRVSLKTLHTFMCRSTWHALSKIGPDDLVHLHSITGFIGGTGLQRLIPPQTMVFWTAHNPWLFTGGCVIYEGCDGFEGNCAGCPILSPAVRPWARLEHKAKQRFAGNRNVQPIANSEWMSALMKQSSIYGDRSDIPVVPPIVDRSFRPGPGAQELRAQLGIGPERFVVGLSSRAVTDTAKGIGQFLASLPDGWSFLPRVTFLVLGAGQLPASEAVDSRCTGHVAGAEELARHYRAMDLFVSPSSMETFGMALLEAQACGTPVAAFRTGGTPEAVCPVAGTLVPNGDFASLRSVVEVSMRNARATEVQADLLHQWVQDRHSAPAIAAKQIAIYRKHGFAKQLAH